RLTCRFHSTERVQPWYARLSARAVYSSSVRRIGVRQQLFFHLCQISAANVSISKCCAERCQKFRASPPPNRSPPISCSKRPMVGSASSSPSFTCLRHQVGGPTKNSKLSKTASLR